MKSGAYDVLSEHQHIRKLVDAIARILDHRDSVGAEWLGQAAPLVEELSAGLVSHFAGEEVELFRDVKERIPRHIPTVEVLTTQHQQLAATFQELRQLLATALSVSPAAKEEELAARLAEVLRELRAHEEQENELMLLAYWQDLGEAD